MGKKKPSTKSDRSATHSSEAISEIELALAQQYPEFNQLPPELQRRLVLKATRQISHSGPVPDPESMARYAEVLPSAPDRMLTMAEKNMDAFIAIEQRKWDYRFKQLEGEITITQRGQWLGFAIATICTGAAVYLGINDQVTVASIVGGSSAVSLLTALVLGNRLKEKQKQAEELIEQKP